MVNPKYTFILPAYKKKYLKNAIDSILAQSFGNFELIIVNDASPEDIDSVINQYSDCRIQYHRNKTNIGGVNLVKQWNHCLSFATGEFVILATDDDEYAPDYLEKMSILVYKYPHVNAFRPRITHIDENNNQSGIECYMAEFSNRNLFLYFFFKRYISTGIGFWIFRRSKLLEVGGYQSMPAAWFADDVTTMALSEAGVVMSNEVLFKFRIHDQSISDQYNNEKLLNKKLQAHTEFEMYYKSYFNKYPKTDETIDDKTIISLADRLNRQIWLYDISKSSKKAIIKNYKSIIQTSKSSRIGTVRLIINRLFH